MREAQLITVTLKRRESRASDHLSQAIRREMLECPCCPSFLCRSVYICYSFQNVVHSPASIAVFKKKKGTHEK
jgi:hypothetical protein